METPNTIGTTVINIDHWYTPSVMSLPLQPWPRGGHVGATWGPRGLAPLMGVFIGKTMVPFMVHHGDYSWI